MSAGSPGHEVLEAGHRPLRPVQQPGGHPHLGQPVVVQQALGDHAVGDRFEEAIPGLVGALQHDDPKRSWGAGPPKNANHMLH